jgi:hypothetical protein
LNNSSPHYQPPKPNPQFTPSCAGHLKKREASSLVAKLGYQIPQSRHITSPLPAQQQIMADLSTIDTTHASTAASSSLDNANQAVVNSEVGLR